MTTSVGFSQREGSSPIASPGEGEAEKGVSKLISFQRVGENRFESGKGARRDPIDAPSGPIAPGAERDEKSPRHRHGRSRRGRLHIKTVIEDGNSCFFAGDETVLKVDPHLRAVRREGWGGRGQVKRSKIFHVSRPTCFHRSSAFTKAAAFEGSPGIPSPDRNQRRSRPHLKAHLLTLPDPRSNGDVQIHFSGEIEITDRTGVNSLARFSSSERISMQRTLGTPVIVPPGRGPGRPRSG